MTSQYSIGEAFALTGTLAISGATTIAGTSTLFLSQLAIGDYITIAGETKIIASVTNNTAAVATVAFSGTSSGNTGTRVRLTPLSDLSTAVVDPRSPFQSYASELNLGNGLTRGGGWKMTQWKWGYLTQAQRDMLRTYCTGASAAVYIRTRQIDSADAYAIYSAKMLWPQSEDRQTGRRLDFEIRFRGLVAWP